MPIYHTLPNPSLRDVLAPLGVEQVQIRRTAAMACGVAALALGFLAVRQYHKAR
jgi:hypothetical protein